MRKLLDTIGRTLLPGLILAIVPLFDASATEALQWDDTARLRENVRVDEKLVTLGDLFSNAGEVADKAVFRAPSIGQSGVVSATRVIEAAMRAGLTRIAPHTIDKVTVSRDSRLVTEDSILEGLIARLRSKGFVSASGRIDIELSTRLSDQHADVSSLRPFDLRNLRFDRTSGLFSAELSLAGRSDIGSIRLNGRAIETILTPVMTRNMRRGEIVSDADITLTPMPRQQVALAKPAKVSSIIGMATRQSLRAGMIANESYFTAPDVVDRSDIVTILFRAGNLSLSMRGKALMAGAVGDVISVQNQQTNKIVRGEIVGPGLVQIMKPTNVIAALGAQAQ